MRTLLSENENSKELWNEEGRVFFEQENYEEAIRCYDKVLEIDPEDMEALYNKAYALDRSDIFLGSLEAIFWFDKALALDPEYKKKKYNQNASTSNKLGNYLEAITWSEEALKIDPECTEALNNKAVALSNLGCYSEAMLWFDKALEVDNALNRHLEAVTWYERLLEVDPETKAAWNTTSTSDIMGVETSGASSIADSSWFSWLTSRTFFTTAKSDSQAASNTAIPLQYTSNFNSQLLFFNAIFHYLGKFLPSNRTRILTTAEEQNLQTILKRISELQRRIPSLAATPSTQTGFLDHNFAYIERQLSSNNQDSLVVQISRLLAKKASRRMVTSTMVSDWIRRLDRVQEYLARIEDLNEQFDQCERKRKALTAENPDKEMVFNLHYNCVHNKLRITHSIQNHTSDIFSGAYEYKQVPMLQQLLNKASFWQQPGQLVLTEQSLSRSTGQSTGQVPTCDYLFRSPFTFLC
jgi:tetratricopeptide (TPR) repeat protein